MADPINTCDAEAPLTAGERAYLLEVPEGCRKSGSFFWMSMRRSIAT